MIDSLKLDDAQAKEIIQLAIDNDAYDGKMPSNKKDRMEAAHDIVTFAIDAWVQDEVRSDSDDEDVAKAGKTVEKILKIAGVKVDESGVIGYEGADDEEEEGDEEGEKDETPFDVDDIIDGWSDMKTTAALEAIEEAEDLTQEQIKALLDDESDRGRPRSKVVDALEAALQAAMGGDDEEGDEEGDGEEEGEPWEGYDKASVKDIKDALESAKDDEDEPLTPEQAQYVLDYEGENKDRAGIKKWLEEFISEAGEDDSTADEEGDEGEEEEDDEGIDLDALDRTELKKLIKDEEWPIKVQKSWSDDDLRAKIAEYVNSLEDEDGEEEGDEPEPEPEPKKTRGRKRGAKSDDPDDSTDVDDAIAKDDEKDAKKSKGIKLTREQILEALSEGHVLIGG